MLFLSPSGRKPCGIHNGRASSLIARPSSSSRQSLNRNLAALGDAERLPLGEGVLKLDPFYSTLLEIGFSGVYSVEVFNPRLWEMGTIPAARLAMGSMLGFES